MTRKMRARSVDLTPPEIRKLPPPARSYYAKIEKTIGQLTLALGFPPRATYGQPSTRELSNAPRH